MKRELSALSKCPSRIRGLDEITFGGLPLGRPTLITGGAGTGKTLFALEFVLRGISDSEEPGVFLTFEESGQELAENVASLGFDLQAYQQGKRLHIEHISLQPEIISEVGEYDLEGLFIRLGAAIAAVDARRVAIDGIDNLFVAFTDHRVLRGEFQRLMRWLKQRGVTSVITSERGQDSLTRHGVEEYVSDCVIALDQRVENQVATRRLRIVKYRGSAHGPNEYPFLLDKGGVWVMPITSLGLCHQVSDVRISSGIADLDGMLGGGYFRGSTVLVTGTVGSGKSSIAANFCAAACRNGQRVLYVALEESPEQIQRNMRSIGLDIRSWVESGLWVFHAVRPTAFGMEAHLASIARLAAEFPPGVAVVDPITAFENAAGQAEIKIMLMRLVDMFKGKGITALFTSLTQDANMAEETSVGVSSLVDSWLLLRNLEVAGEHTRGLYVLKSRGTAHSNQIREFRLSANGVRLLDVEVDNDGTVLVGAARVLRKKRIQADSALREDDIQRRRALLENRRQMLEAKINAMQAEFEAELRSLESELALEERHLLTSQATMDDVVATRTGDV